jgi:hypothetical protein
MWALLQFLLGASSWFCHWFCIMCLTMCISRSSRRFYSRTCRTASFLWGDHTEPFVCITGSLLHKTSNPVWALAMNVSAWSESEAICGVDYRKLSKCVHSCSFKSLLRWGQPTPPEMNHPESWSILIHRFASLLLKSVGCHWNLKPLLP